MAFGLLGGIVGGILGDSEISAEKLISFTKNLASSEKVKELLKNFSIKSKNKPQGKKEKNTLDQTLVEVTCHILEDSGEIELSNKLKNRTEKEIEDDKILLLIAIINASKIDGEIDSEELKYITNYVCSSNISKEVKDYIINMMKGPLETEYIIEAVSKRPELGPLVYLASELILNIDTEDEDRYLSEFAESLKIPETVLKHLRSLENKAG